MGFSPLPNSRMQTPTTGQAAPSMPTQGSSRMGMFGGGWGGMFNPRSLFGQMPSPQVGIQQGAMPRSLAWYLPLLMSRGMFGRPFTGNMPSQAQGTPQAPNVAQPQGPQAPASPITAPQAPMLPYAPPPTFQAPTQQQAQPIVSQATSASTLPAGITGSEGNYMYQGKKAFLGPSVRGGPSTTWYYMEPHDNGIGSYPVAVPM